MRHRREQRREQAGTGCASGEPPRAADNRQRTLRQASSPNRPAGRPARNFLQRAVQPAQVPGGPSARPARIRPRSKSMTLTAPCASMQDVVRIEIGMVDAGRCSRRDRRADRSSSAPHPSGCVGERLAQRRAPCDAPCDEIAAIAKALPRGSARRPGPAPAGHARCRRASSRYSANDAYPRLAQPTSTGPRPAGRAKAAAAVVAQHPLLRAVGDEPCGCRGPLPAGIDAAARIPEPGIEQLPRRLRRACRPAGRWSARMAPPAVSTRRPLSCSRSLSAKIRA